MSNSKVVSSTGLPCEKTSREPGSSATPLTSRRLEGWRGARLVAAQDGADARRQFARVEGLGEVVVGAQFEADDAVDILAAGGEHHDRNFALLAQAAEDFEAVDAGQHDVEDHQAKVAAQGRFQAAPAFVFALDG